MELGFLGFRVVLLEKRETFSRNNVLHLWPFAIHDLRGLGAKKFYGKFCAGAIDHISEPAPQLLRVMVVVTGVVVSRWWRCSLGEVQGIAFSCRCFLSAGIRQLQLILLKVALLLGVEVHVGVEFKRLLEPPGEQRPTHREDTPPFTRIGPLNEARFSVLV